MNSVNMLPDYALSVIQLEVESVFFRLCSFVKCFDISEDKCLMFCGGGEQEQGR